MNWFKRRKDGFKAMGLIAGCIALILAIIAVGFIIVALTYAFYAIVIVMGLRLIGVNV